MKTYFNKISLLFAIAAAAHLTLHAATHNVSVGNNFFNPANITINQGDTVRWTWIGNGHTVTSGTRPTASGLFNSGLRNNGAVFTFTFNDAGVFPYFCQPHAGQNGSVTVQAVNQDPVVTITSPTNNATFPAGAVQVTAEASDDGSVASVQLFNGNTSLGTADTSAPYVFDLVLSAGSYNLIAQVTDNLGAVSVSPVVTINVTNSTVNSPELSNPQKVGNEFRFTVNSSALVPHTIQLSTDATNWSNLSTNTPVDGSFQFSEQINPNAVMLLFRVVLP
ncbi:MAG: Ig-like domain-containing protein [Verrucomicrobiota bacterium]|nr:Ig-like domain-containing protein [Verrucomicrobiota bacterium]